MMHQMKCGGCGCDTAKIEAQGNNPFFKGIDLICTQCGSRTTLRLRAQIEVSMAEDSDGAFCVGWGSADG